MKSFLFLLAVPLQNVLAQAPTPRGELIRPGVDTLAVFIVNGNDTTRTGFVVDEVAIAEQNGRQVIRRVYKSQDRVLGVRVDTIIDDATTLAPISVRSRTSRSLEFIDFYHGRAKGWMMLANGDSVGVDVPIGADAYGSATFDLVLRSSPLKEGWKAQVPAFLSSTRAVIQLYARVDNAEDVDGSPAWRVQADFGGTPVIFWIDKISRQLVRQVMQVRPDVAILFTRPRPLVQRPRNAT